MRKGKEQQKNETSRQLKLFTMQAGELTGSPTGGTGTERLNRIAFTIGETANLNHKLIRKDCRLWELNESVQAGCEQ
jgi:hypothetical protein